MGLKDQAAAADELFDADMSYTCYYDDGSSTTCTINECYWPVYPDYCRCADAYDWCDANVWSFFNIYPSWSAWADFEAKPELLPWLGVHSGTNEVTITIG